MLPHPPAYQKPRLAGRAERTAISRSSNAEITTKRSIMPPRTKPLPIQPSPARAQPGRPAQPVRHRWHWKPAAHQAAALRPKESSPAKARSFLDLLRKGPLSLRCQVFPRHIFPVMPVYRPCTGGGFPQSAGPPDRRALSPAPGLFETACRRFFLRQCPNQPPAPRPAH